MFTRSLVYFGCFARTGDEEQVGTGGQDAVPLSSAAAAAACINALTLAPPHVDSPYLAPDVEAPPAPVAAAVRTLRTGMEEPDALKPFLNFLLTRFRWRSRPVPVVLRRIAFSLQLTAQSDRSR